MLDKLAHAVTPLAVIAAATVLGALHVIDSTTAVALITGAGGYGVIAVAKGGPK
jgi:hypothetical protein